MYEVRATSDSFRVTKNARIYAISSCPLTEKRICLIVSDGRILIWQLHTVDDIDEKFSPKFSLSDIIKPEYTDQDNKRLKFIMTGMMNGLGNNLTIKMCPPLTTKNLQDYLPLLAVGNGYGNVQIYDLSNGSLKREFSVHSCQVRGIEWLGLKKFISFAYPSLGYNGQVRNEIVICDISSGRSHFFRPNRDEEAPIEGLRVSHFKQYVTILFKERPFELWDLKTETLLRQMPSSFPKLFAVEWSPNPASRLKKKHPLEVEPTGEPSMSDSVTSIKSSDAEICSKECLFLSDTEGGVYQLIIEGNILKEGPKIALDNSVNAITSIARKGDIMLLGDTEGNLCVTDLKNRVNRVCPTNKNWVKKTKFGPGKGNMKFLSLFNDSVDIRDAGPLSKLDPISVLKCPKDVSKITDVDWAASDRPVIVCQDGTIKIFDMNLKTCSSSFDEFILAEPIFSPYIISPKHSLAAKSLLQHQSWREEYSFNLECETEIQPSVLEALKAIDDDIKSYMINCKFGIAERALITSTLFGDEFDFAFWTVALHYLRRSVIFEKQKTESPPNDPEDKDLFVPTPSRVVQTTDLLKLEDDNQGSILVDEIADESLESSFDILADRLTFKKRELARAFLHDQKRTTADHTRTCAESLLLLGQAERAVQLFLETDAGDDNYYVDCLRACLVASIRSSGASQSTIKLVATSLIANGKLIEGVQLLCLIEKGVDACRYLQTYGQWYKAAWLAKSTLSDSECDDVIKRWTEHLSSNTINEKVKNFLNKKHLPLNY
ncbi:DgyrCDS13819 [Dimorphilus gyrociliatus]|uniref:DgyrCDS13819 n=1 Tax=Dimorphilus gyrociliatus TaxID=2664684 RepID=A0A7I8WBW7_9ANNE|nr:DgyrCDS13819 [Dimorphilus gyrociliatus]